MKSYVFILLSLLIACSGKEPKDTQKPELPTSQEPMTAIPARSYEVCADSIAKLVSTSNFLIVGHNEGFDWKDRWEKDGRFTTEFDDSGNMVIHAYLVSNEPETGDLTVGWLIIDSSRKSFELSGLNEDDPATPLKHNTQLLQYVIAHCIDWSKR